MTKTESAESNGSGNPPSGSSPAEDLGAAASNAWDLASEVAEFLLQVLSHVGGVINVLAAILTIWGYRGYRRWRAERRKTDSGGPDYARRRTRRGHRRPPTQLLRAYGAPLPERLVASMQCFGRSPIEPYRHRSRVVASWRGFRRGLLPVKTIPKSAFTTTYWQYRPLGTTELADGLPFSGGFDFSLLLNSHENRWHLRRSLWAERSRSRARRLLVIATTRDMFDPESWVRCLVVNAGTLRLPQDELGWAVLRGADPWANDGPLVYRSRQKDVPDDAVWLMVPTCNYRLPAPSWGEEPEHHGQQPQVPLEPVRRDCDDANVEDYLGRWVRYYRKLTMAAWTALGLGVPLVVWLLSMPTRLAGDQAETDEIAMILAAYVLFFVMTAAVALGRLAYESTRAWCWRKRENQELNDWKGGTHECLLLGDLLRRGPDLRSRDWREHAYGAVPPTEQDEDAESGHARPRSLARLTERMARLLPWRRGRGM